MRFGPGKPGVRGARVGIESVESAYRLFNRQDAIGKAGAPGLAVQTDIF